MALYHSKKQTKEIELIFQFNIQYENLTPLHGKNSVNTLRLQNIKNNTTYLHPLHGKQCQPFYHAKPRYIRF